MRYVLLIAIAAGIAAAQTPFPHDTQDNGEAPNRTCDIVHYNISVSFDEANKKVFGTTSITLSPLFPSLREASFDAEDMEFSSVTLGKKKLDFTVQPKTVTVQFDRPYSYRDTLILTFTYVATPKKGVYFIQPDSGYPNKPRQIWSQGEDMDNHHWFPCYDFPNDKATSEVTGTVPRTVEFLSNGRLEKVKEDKKRGTKTYHWVQGTPHSSYLIMMAAGEYAVLRDKVDGIPLEYYVYKDQTDDARACLTVTRDIMHFFNERIGVRYAWDKYAQIQIRDFMYGGMENTSATTMLDWELVTDARGRIDNDPTSLVAHELAHQWWGDVVTCKDWRHLWLNESFASYFDPLYFEYARGEDEFTKMMFDAQQAGIRTDNARGRRPIVSVGSYTENLYPRGASVLHMLRFVLGDDLFFRGLKYYITKYRYQPVETDDLKNALEECTGQNLYWFFDEWVYKAGHPVFDVSYTYNDSSHSVSLTVKQTQKQDSLTGIFRMPVDIDVTTAAGTVTHRINILNGDSTYALPCPERPLMVLFDRGNHILKELHFTKSAEDWKYQAIHGSDVVARILALRELSRSGDQQVVIPFYSSCAASDPFWGVREEAVKSLAGVNDSTGAATPALLAALHDTKSNVRAEAASALGEIRTAEVSAALRGAIDRDSSYVVVANALTAIAKVDSTAALPLLIAKLDGWSFHNRVANAALSGIASVDSSEGIRYALRRVEYGAEPLGRTTAMRILRRYGKGNKQVLAKELSLAYDKEIQRSVVTALGDQNDAEAIPVLETIAKERSNPVHEAAERAIEKIRKNLGQ